MVSTWLTSKSGDLAMFTEPEVKPVARFLPDFSPIITSDRVTGILSPSFSELEVLSTTVMMLPVRPMNARFCEEKIMTIYLFTPIGLMVSEWPSARSVVRAVSVEKVTPSAVVMVNCTATISAEFSMFTGSEIDFPCATVTSGISSVFFCAHADATKSISRHRVVMKCLCFILPEFFIS